MADKPADRKNAEATRKGTKKVNLGEIKGRINKRGRDRFTDPVLEQSFRGMLADGEPFIWLDAVPVGNTADELTNSKAMWRARAVSVFRSLNSEKKISVAWTTDNEMVLMLKA
jgi:hypothetical protein